jgi:hypothetical protein
MSIFIGSSELQDLYVGSNQVQEVYQGSTLVWSNVPNINYNPDQWTGGAAGSIWTLSEQDTATAGFVTDPSFNTSYMRLNTEINLSGSFITTYQDAVVAVPNFSSTGSYRLHYTLSQTSASSGGTTATQVSAVSGATGSTQTRTSSGTYSQDFTVTSLTGVQFRLRHAFINTAGATSGSNSRVNISNVYLEKL